MNCKAKGSRNERKTIRMLEALGYRCMKAAASLGVFDIFRIGGIGQADVLCIQVKSNEWPRAAEMTALAAFPVPPNVRKLVHRWRDRARAGCARSFLTSKKASLHPAGLSCV